MFMRSPRASQGPTCERLRGLFDQAAAQGLAHGLRLDVEFTVKPPRQTDCARRRSSPLDQGRVADQVPKEVNGRAGQGAELLTKASTNVREEPAVVLRAEPLLKYSSLVVAPMVAPKRLPASRLAPLSTDFPSYQSLSVPELCPAPEQVLRAETLMLS